MFKRGSQFCNWSRTILALGLAGFLVVSPMSPVAASERSTLILELAPPPSIPEASDVPAPTVEPRPQIESSEEVVEEVVGNSSADAVAETAVTEPVTPEFVADGGGETETAVNVSSSETRDVVVSTITVDSGSATTPDDPVAGEDQFTTALASPAPVEDVSIGGSGGGSGNDDSSTMTTSTGDSQIAISDEFGDASLPHQFSRLAISAEFGSYIAEPPTTGGQLAISDEFDRATAPFTGGQLAISGEFGGQTGITTPTTPGEQSFTTAAPGSDGGGGGGGGGIRRAIVPLAVASLPPTPCPLYLKKFIKLGADNDRLEVIKLQVFLRQMEGFAEVPISGVYDQTTFGAVSAFQLRYGRDVLTPWGIDDSTGYVFITTRLAINNLYCQRSTANNLDLRNFYPVLAVALAGESISSPIPPEWGRELPAAVATTSGEVIGATTTVTTERNFFQAAALGLLNLIGSSGGWFLILILLLILLALIFLIWRLRDVEEGNYPTLGPPTGGGGVSAAGSSSAVDLADLPETEEEMVVDEMDNDWLLPESEAPPSREEYRPPPKAQPPLDNLT